MTGEQLLFPSGPQTPETEATLDLVDADPLHDRDRAAIDAAVRAVARANDGMVDPGQVRRRLCDDNGNLTVYPRVLSARYFALRRAGVLEPAGWVVNDDRHGRNAGRPARLYRWVGAAS